MTSGHMSVGWNGKVGRGNASNLNGHVFFKPNSFSPSWPFNYFQYTDHVVIKIENALWKQSGFEIADEGDENLVIVGKTQLLSKF